VTAILLIWGPADTRYFAKMC